MVRIIIWDTPGSVHANQIIIAINSGYGADISEQFEVLSSGAFDRAVSDSNIIAILRSYTGVSGYVTSAQNVYPRVSTFFPLGSNNFELLSVFQNEEPPVIVTSGAGDYEEKNNTGYGNGLEFWDRDNNWNDGGDESSYSNGYVLGKLLKIKDMRNCSWWEARYIARMTADRTESNRQNWLWDLRNGYGKINVEKAINYKGFIPDDPYIPKAQEATYYGNTAQSYTASVPDGYTGEPVTYSVAENTVFSTVDQESADELALVYARYVAENLLDVSPANIVALQKEFDTDYGIGNYLIIDSVSNNNIWISIYQNKNSYDNNKEPLRKMIIKFNFDVIKNQLYLYLSSISMFDNALIINKE
jgi:hypothetical protein